MRKTYKIINEKDEEIGSIGTYDGIIIFSILTINDFDFYNTFIDLELDELKSFFKYKLVEE